MYHVTRVSTHIAAAVTCSSLVYHNRSVLLREEEITITNTYVQHVACVSTCIVAAVACSSLVCQRCGLGWLVWQSLGVCAVASFDGVSLLLVTV